MSSESDNSLFNDDEDEEAGVEDAGVSGFREEVDGGELAEVEEPLSWGTEGEGRSRDSAAGTKGGDDAFRDDADAAEGDEDGESEMDSFAMASARADASGSISDSEDVSE